MKTLIVTTFFLMLIPFTGLAQVKFTPVPSLEEAVKLGVSPLEVSEAVKSSKEKLTEALGKEDAQNLDLISVEFYLMETDLSETKPNLPPTLEMAVCPYRRDEYKPTHKNQLADHFDDTNKIVKELEKKSGKNNGGMLYITWGYNRGFHSNADVIVDTPDGTFIIKDAVGKDRPSTELKTYLDITKLTIPQYNLRVGYWITPNFGVEVGTDHMKWVFDNSQKYQIEGEYLRDVWINGQQVAFAQAVESGDASFLKLEHSDGYNYPFVGVVFKKNLIDAGRFQADAIGGAGLGIMFPKTRTTIFDNPDSSSPRDVDNKFKVSGWGAHADARLRLKYLFGNGASVFLEPASRLNFAKTNSAPFLGPGTGSVEHSPMVSVQVMVSAGVEIPLRFGSKSKKKKAMNSP